MKKIIILLGVLLMSLSLFSNEIHLYGEAIKVKDNTERIQEKKTDQGFIHKIVFDIWEVLVIPFKNFQIQYYGGTYVGEGMDEGEFTE